MGLGSLWHGPVVTAAVVALATGARGEDDPQCIELEKIEKTAARSCEIGFIFEACPAFCSEQDRASTRGSVIENLEKSAIIVAAPVLMMMIGSIIALFVDGVNPVIQVVFSSISVGILVAAVGFELLPILEEGNWYAAPLGMFFGVVVFVVLGRILPDLDDDDDDDDDEDDGGGRSLGPRKYGAIEPSIEEGDAHTAMKVSEREPLLREPPVGDSQKPTEIPATKDSQTEVRICTGQACKHESPGDLLHDIEDLLERSKSDLIQTGTNITRVIETHCIQTCKHHGGPNVLVHNGNSTMIHNKVSSAKLSTIISGINETPAIEGSEIFTGSEITGSENGNDDKDGFRRAATCSALPWTRLAAIALDGSIDGLLLGIASTLGNQEALLIAIGMSIEMCFVGVTLSLKLQSYPHNSVVKAAIVLLLPLSMYIGLLVGVYALYDVDQTSDIFIGVVGFGVTALLYLAFIELLPEAFELGEENGMKHTSEIVSTSLFGGFCIILILELTLGDEANEI